MLRLVVGVLLVVHCCSSSPVEQTEEGELQEGDREGKLFSVFQIIKFNNDVCTASDSSMGTCYTSAECTAAGGSDGGPCASGFGVCCKAVIDPACPATVKINNTRLVNPGFPDTVSTAVAGACSSEATSGTTRQARQTTTVTDCTGDGCTWKITKISTLVTQLRIDFTLYDTSTPDMGDCTNDTITFTGLDAVTVKALPTNLCGLLTGQHLYLSVKDAAVTEGVSLTIKLSSASTQKWDILVSQYESTEPDLIAPRGCLQYFRESSGTISSFNHNSGSGELLNDHMYSACIQPDDALCDVSLTSTAFDLSGSSGACMDSVAFGTTVYCGSTFGTSGSAIWNFTGPYTIPMMSDSDNSAMVAGYSISYMLLPC